MPLILCEIGGIFNAPLAQLGERSTFNREVMGSRPIWGTTAWIFILTVTSQGYACMPWNRKEFELR